MRASLSPSPCCCASPPSGLSCPGSPDLSVLQAGSPLSRQSHLQAEPLASRVKGWTFGVNVIPEHRFGIFRSPRTPLHFGTWAWQECRQNGMQRKLVTVRTSLLDSRTHRSSISEPLTLGEGPRPMSSELHPPAGRTQGCVSWAKRIQFAFKCHLQAFSFLLTTQVIEVENVKVQT